MVGNRPKFHRMHPMAPGGAVVVAGAALIAFAGPSAAAVTSVAGGAFGEQVDITLTGLGRQTDGPRPAVSLPASGGSFTQSLPSVSIGPAGLFLTSGALAVNSQGTTGATGSVTSSATVTSPNVLETLQASSVASMCSAREGAVSGSTTIADGTLLQSGTTTIPLPTNPAPNQSFDGTNADTGDEFTVILNQQQTVGGVLVVNAVNFVLRGPTATGFIILGQSRCGVSATAATTTTRGSATTRTTGVTATTQAPTVSGGGGDGDDDDDGLARTGPAAPLLPALGGGLLLVAVTASRRARRRPGGAPERPDIR